MPAQKAARSATLVYQSEQPSDEKAAAKFIEDHPKPVSNWIKISLR